jgi:hypothetical protein
LKAGISDGTCPINTMQRQSVCIRPSYPPLSTTESPLRVGGVEDLGSLLGALALTVPRIAAAFLAGGAVANELHGFQTL